MLPDSVIRRLGALSLKVESHIHGNVNVWFGGGDTHVPLWYDGLYPTRANGCILYRAVDKLGQTIDFLLTEKRDQKAAKRTSGGI